MFITFEGIEGSGKTTQARRLADWLTARGARIWLTREPGGTPLAEAIRQVVLQPLAARAALGAAHLVPDLGERSPDVITPAAELLLMNAARAQLVAEVRQCLARREVVICDRYADATRAYQGGGRGLDPRQVEAAIAISTGGLVPDLTLLLDADPRVGLARKRSQAENPAEWNRLDDEDLAFHQRVRAAYLALAAAEPDRWWVLDAQHEPDALAEQIQHLIADHWPVDEAGVVN